LESDGLIKYGVPVSKPKILVTGGTGFLGTKVVPLLREYADVHVISRNGMTELTGDLTLWNSGLDLNKIKLEKYTALIHMAGLYDLKATAAECSLHNTFGTDNALKITQYGDIPIFINMSSVAAAINRKKTVVNPADTYFQSPFPDAYSETKASCEQTIKYWDKASALRINLRLGILVGDSVDGIIKRIDGPYHAPETIRRLQKTIENFPGAIPLPGSAEVHIPLLPVDIAAKAIIEIFRWSLSTSETGYKSLHLAPRKGLNVLELYEKTFLRLGINNKKINLVEHIPDFLMIKISKGLARFPEEEMKYLLAFPEYDTSATRKLLGENWCPEFSEYEDVFWRGYEKYISNR
jgi:UDP-glucose 4-epimerase